MDIQDTHGKQGYPAVQYEGLQGEGSGVVVFANGRAFGGDEGYTYVGDYMMQGGNVPGR